MPDQWGRPTMDDGLRVMQGISSMKQADQTERRMKMLEEEHDYLKKERDRTAQERDGERAWSNFHLNTDPNDPEYATKRNELLQKFGDKYDASIELRALGLVASTRWQDEQTRAARMRNDLVEADETFKKGQTTVTTIAASPLSMETAQTLLDIVDNHPGTGLHSATVTSIDDDNNVTFTAKDSNGNERTMTQPWEDMISMAQAAYRMDALPGFAKQTLFRGQMIREHNLKALSNYETLVNDKGEKLYVYSMLDKKGRPATLSMDSSGGIVSFDGKIDDLPENIRQMLPNGGEKLPTLPPASFKRAPTTADQEAAIKGQKQQLEEDKFAYDKNKDKTEREDRLREFFMDIMKWTYPEGGGPTPEQLAVMSDKYVQDRTGKGGDEPNPELEKARQGIIEKGRDVELSGGKTGKAGKIGDELHVFNPDTKQWATIPVPDDWDETGGDSGKDSKGGGAESAEGEGKGDTSGKDGGKEKTAPDLSREDKKLLNYYAKEIQKKNPDKSKKAIAEEALQMVQDAKEKQRAMAGNLGSQIKGRARDIAEPIEKLRSMVPRVERVEPAKEEDFSQYLK